MQADKERFHSSNSKNPGLRAMEKALCYQLLVRLDETQQLKLDTDICLNKKNIKEQTKTTKNQTKKYANTLGQNLISIKPMPESP